MVGPTRRGLAGILAVALLVPDQTVGQAALAPPPGYDLVWQEEFSVEGLPSPANWQFDTSRNRAGWYNGELQYYSDARARNARVKHGRLILTARRESPSSASDWNGQRFTSARLTTRGRHNWRGGFFEVRAKLPCKRGAWPAIWLFPDSEGGDWSGGEIDIAEVVGHDPDTVHHAVHTADKNFKQGNHERAVSRIRSCEEFHVYQALWTAEEVIIGVDGAVALRTSAHAFDRPMSLIVNVAVGGDWAGEAGIDNRSFPIKMEVDYVRVWQPPAESSG